MATIYVRRIYNGEVVKQFETQFTGARLQEMIDGLCRNMDIGRFYADVPEAEPTPSSKDAVRIVRKAAERIDEVETANAKLREDAKDDRAAMNTATARLCDRIQELGDERNALKTIIARIRRADKAGVINEYFLNQDEAFLYLNGRTAEGVATEAVRRMKEDKDS